MNKSRSLKGKINVNTEIHYEFTSRLMTHGLQMGWILYISGW